MINSLSALRKLALVFAILLGVELALRLPYPWDMYVWAESPFMTDLWKMTLGQPIYTSPEVANSFVYSPGLEYLTYGLLRPLNLQLDVRWVRLVAIALGTLAALTAATVVTQVADRLQPLKSQGAALTLSACVFGLLLFANLTADIPHPDNLHILQALVALLLTYQALVRKRFGLALAAVLVASLGVLTKQTAALMVVGVLGALLWGHRWDRKQTLLLLAAGLIPWGTSLTWLLTWDEARFYTLELLASHDLQPLYKLSLFWREYGFLTPYRVLVGLFTATALATGYRRLGRCDNGAFILAWSCIGLTAVLPNILPFFKALGIWNNFAIIDIWVLLLGWPLFLALPQHWLRRPDLTGEGPEPPRGSSWRWRQAVVVGLVVALIPLKAPALPVHYQYCQELEQRIGQDLQAGKQVLVPHGAMFLLHNYKSAVPWDRVSSYIELWVGGLDERAGTLDRIASHYYDRLYLNASWWYGDRLMALIEEHYQEVDRLPEAPRQAGLVFSQQRLLNEVRIMEPR